MANTDNAIVLTSIGLAIAATALFAWTVHETANTRVERAMGADMMLVEFSEGHSDGDGHEVQTRNFNGELGGWMQCGSFTVIVLPGAFEGEREITAVDTSGDVLECSLYPRDMAVNGKVLLRTDVATQAALDSLSFLSGEEGAWHQLTTGRDFGQNRLEAPIDRLSTIRLGSVAFTSAGV